MFGPTAQLPESPDSQAVPVQLVMPHWSALTKALSEAIRGIEYRMMAIESLETI